MLDKLVLSCQGRYPHLLGVEGFRTDGYRGDDFRWQGSIGPIHIRQYPNRFTILVSLPKLLFGENVTVLHRKDVERAIHEVEERIKLGLEKAKVCSVEIGSSIVTSRSAGEYLVLFGDCPRFKQWVCCQFGKVESVTYFTPKGSYKFIGYDKALQMIEGGRQVPPAYQGGNIFRLEYVIKNSQGIREKFGDGLTAYDLFVPDVYAKLKRLFHGFYLSIVKNGRGICMELWDGPVTPKGFKDMLAEQFRQRFPDECRRLISEKRLKGQMSDSSYNLLRSWFMAANPKDRGLPASARNDLIAELDALVSSCVENG